MSPLMAFHVRALIVNFTVEKYALANLAPFETLRSLEFP